MFNSTRSHRRTCLYLVVAALVATSCGSSSTTVAEPVAADATVAPTAVEDAPTDEVEAQAPAAAPVAPAAAVGSVQVVLDDGRTWDLTPVICVYAPDATGPAAAVINIAGYNDAGAEVNALEAWPFDGSTEGGTSFVGNFVDEAEVAYFFQSEPSVSVTGDVVVLTTGYYLDVFYADGDGADGLITIRCTP